MNIFSLCPFCVCQFRLNLVSVSEVIYLVRLVRLVYSRNNNKGGVPI